MDLSENRVELTDELKAKLNAVSTATLAGQLQRRGMINAFLNRLKTLNEGQRMVGIARTLRYVPKRPDFEKRSSGPNAQRRAVEGCQPDEVLVMEAREEPDAGTIGDIFAMRVKQLGGAGVITDGALRDTPAIAEIGLPVYHGSSHAATLGRLHTPLAEQVPIVCAGVTVFPGDIIVGDNEGVCAIPAHLAAAIAETGPPQDHMEGWVNRRLSAGHPIKGLYPPDANSQAAYKKWIADGEPD